jgi:hypothetical protein
LRKEQRQVNDEEDALRGEFWKEEKENAMTMTK